MNSLRRTLFCLVGALVFCSLSLLAQSLTTPLTKSPVELFRELLKMSSEERKQAISSRPAETQERIFKKLAEYQILPGELQELRLRETELRWYLRPLMDEPPTNRAARLAQIPEDERKIVEERLHYWDILPPPLQQQWKNDDVVVNYLAQNASATPQEQKDMLAIMPPDLRDKLQQGLDRWNGMTEDQRQKALAGFNNFFKLTPEEKKEALDTVSDAEREQMQKTLDAYGNLTPQQRTQCIHSFEKFARMSVSERQQFLKNAERWNAMTPEEREKWRRLVTVAPITPPTENPSSPAKLPVRSLRSTSPDMATN